MHLLLKTKHFGVNNRWWSSCPSDISWSMPKKLFAILLVLPIWRNYQALRFRALAGWMPKAHARDYFKQ